MRPNDAPKAPPPRAPLPGVRYALLIAALCACGRHSPGAVDAGGDGGPDDGGVIVGGGDGGGIPIPQVVVKSVLPASGPTGGGGSVMVDGSGFVQGFALHGGSAASSETSVSFGGAAATGIDVIDDNRIELTVPPGAAGRADVKVVNPNGSGACTGCYRYVTPVKVSSIAPATGSTAGGTAVTVKGQGFSSDLLLTIGGRELIGLSLVDAQTATGRTPPGPAGAADVLAITPDGAGELRSGYVYADALRVDAVAPLVVPTAGGARLTVTGAGFSAGAQVQVGGATVASAWVDAQTLQLIAPPHAAGAVSLTVDGAATTLVYADAGGTRTAYAVAPSHGPAAGGIAVHILGTGLTGAAVTIGGAAAAALASSTDVELDVTLPAGTPGPADVVVGAQTLAGAFVYDAPLAVSAVAPAAAPASGTPATQVTLTGVGLDQAAHVFIGALEAAIVGTPSATSLTATAPAGSPGPADVVVIAGSRTARLAGGFTFTTPLAISQISPSLGAQAGGTRVNLYGRGFSAPLAATIGGAAAAAVQVLSPTQATALTPPGTPGARDVGIAAAGQSAALPQSFTYFDPTNPLVGAGGGLLLGVLNVTVLDFSAFKTGGVQGATVLVTLHDGARLSGLTDANGQITFSDDRLVLPAQVSAIKDQYDAVTVGEVSTANLTVYLSGPAGTPPPPPTNPPTPPPPLPTSTIGGHVYGFKLPPGTVLADNQRAVARVSIAAAGIYSLPPFAGAPPFLTVTSDGGSYSFSNVVFSLQLTLYAVFGIEDTAAHTFAPVLLGVLRGFQPVPETNTTNADIILDTHLDQSVQVTIDSPPSVLGGHDAFVSLDLGPAGAIPLDRVTENADPSHFTFHNLPQASGQGFVFVDQYGAFQNGAVTPPVTVYLRRVFDDLSAGVTLGPLLALPVVTQAGPAGFAWTLGPSALQPNLQQLRVGDGTQLQDTSWRVLMPGDARQMALPDPVRQRLLTGAHPYTLTLSVSPAFDFAHWTDEDLGSGSWTAYAYTIGSFTAP